MVAPVRASLEEHLGSRDVARVIYGSVIGLALLLALEDHPPTAVQAVAAVLGTAFAVACAELYSEVVGREAVTRRATHRARLRRMTKDAAAVFVGAAFPAIFFLLSAVGVMQMPTAFRLAKWTGLGLICGYGFLAARLAGRTPLKAVLQSLIVGFLGIALILLKTLTH